MDKKILLVIGLGILFLLPAGCIDLGKEEEKAKEIYKVGNYWVYNVVSDFLGTGTITFTVTNEMVIKNGVETLEVTTDYTFPPYTDDEGTIWDTLTGGGKDYHRITDMEYVYSETTLNTRYKEYDYQDWTSLKMVMTSNYITVGSVPEKLKVGDTYSLQTTENFAVKYYYDEVYDSEETDDSTNTTNYEVKSKKDVTVPAGKFTCFEIRQDVIGDTTYTLEYTNDEVGTIKSVEYSGETIINLRELKAYKIK